jgi:hypothetical protein
MVRQLIYAASSSLLEELLQLLARFCLFLSRLACGEARAGMPGEKELGRGCCASQQL